MTLYLKNRPQNIKDLDLENVREVLKKFVKSKNIPHAYLFFGPKGTGKTSAARILAKSLNCENFDFKEGEPCGKCYQCISISKGENLDVIELDAASNRGIDDIRLLRDAVKLAPGKAKAKVYVIDEVHMLTTEASNALLKTLEEPPNHVYFVLATTNPEKLIPTIKSRTVEINFHKATIDELTRSLQRTVNNEKVKYDEEALKVIAENSDGSFRDATKFLEQLLNENIILKSKEVKDFFSKGGSFDVDTFLQFLADKNSSKTIELVEEAVKMGKSVKDITNEIILSLRKGLYFNLGLGGEKIAGFDNQSVLKLIKSFTGSLHDLPVSLIEQIPLEVAIVQWCEDGDKTESSKKGNKNGNNKNERLSLKKNEKRMSLDKKGVVKNESGISVLINSNNQPSMNLDSEGTYQNSIKGEKAILIDDELWKKILAIIRPKNTSTEALLRASKPLSFDGKKLTLGVFYSFHKEKLEVNPHRMILESTISEVVGGNIHVNCTLVKPQESSSIESQSGNGELLMPNPKAESVNGEEDAALSENNDKDIVNIAKEIFGS